MKLMGIAVVVFTLAVTSIGRAADTKVLKSRDGGCQVTIPADWEVSSLGASADSPDKKVSVTLSSPKMIDSFSELKNGAKTAYKNSKVIKDSASDFGMEGQSITGVPDVYRAISISQSKFCIVESMYKTGDPAVARGVIATLRAAQ
jgi:hypothetical protein